MNFLIQIMIFYYLNYYFQGKEIYFNLENRTIEDLNIIYNFYAPLLRYKTNLD